MHPERPTAPPLVLIASDRDWSARSLDAVLSSYGYSVLRAYTGVKALERVSSTQPDIIIVESLPDVDPLDFCWRLRRSNRVTPSTPIVLAGTARPTRNETLAALRAGASDYIGHPVDAEELVLRFDAMLRAKFDADRVRQDALVDPPTGLYNNRGIERRAREIGAQAYRGNGPVACVAVAWPGHDREVTEAALAAATAHLKRVLRTSDVIGRMGEAEFVIVAPTTDSTGAVRMAERLRESILDQAPERDSAGGLRCGFVVVANYRDTPVEMMDLVARAKTALREAEQQSDGPWIRCYRTN